MAPHKAAVIGQSHDRNSSISDISKSMSEKHVSDDEVEWRYLEFDTELPYPARSDLPPCPDLKKYTSPFDWPEQKKTAITWLSCTATAVTAYTAGSYAPAVPNMAEEWGVSEVAALVGITTFTCGFAVAPMFLAPFSEINGRRPIFIITGILYVIFQLTCAVVPTYAGMLIVRFLVGCMSSTFSTMVGGVVSDIYHAKDRNTAMALFSGAALFGTGIGPLVSSVLVTHTNWRWVFWLQVITCAVMMGAVVLFFQETRGSVLLSRKAKILNQWYEEVEKAGSSVVVDDKPTRLRWKVKSDEERTSIARMIAISLYRPFYLLITEPTVFFFSLWVSFSWAILYLTFSAIPLVFSVSHGFDVEQQGAVFAAISIASILSTILSVVQERYARRYLTGKYKELFDRPEGRLFFTCGQSVLLPIGCFWFGWTSYPSIPWIVPALAIGCVTMGIFSIYLAVFNYLADTYQRYASSALAAQSFCRNMLGGAFPLFTEAMFLKMTFQGAGSFLGGFSLLLTIVPFVLLIWGPQIRKRSKFASAMT